MHVLIVEATGSWWTPLLDDARTWLVAVVLTTLVSAGPILYLFVRHRRLWDLGNPETAVVFVAASQSKFVEDQAGGYWRPSTGLGQVNALVEAIPSLSRAYPVAARDIAERVRMCQCDEDGDGAREFSVTGDDAKWIETCDVISLGGAKNNPVTRMFLEELGRDPSFPLTQDPEKSEFSFGPPLSLRTYGGSTDSEGRVTEDYGYIVRFDRAVDAADTPNRRRRLGVIPARHRKSGIILAGCHTFGVTAAAKYFVREMHDRSLPYDAAVVVRASVYGNSWSAFAGDVKRVGLAVRTDSGEWTTLEGS